MTPPSADARLARSLRVDAERQPCGLASEHPCFSWQVPGNLAETPPTVVTVTELAPDGDRELWHHRLLAGDDPQLAYGGPPLGPVTRYRCRVTVEGTRETRAEGEFTTGLLHGTGWAGAAWLAAPPVAATHPRGATPAPELATDFTLQKDVHLALLFVAAGGYAQPWLNGERLSDAELAPTFADYEKRVLYGVCDLTEQLGRGDHRLAFRLGRGFFAMTNPSPPPAWGWEKAPWHEEPCVRAVLHVVYADGTRTAIATGPDWTAQRTSTLYDDLYAGETWDATATFEPAPALPVVGPRGSLHRDRLEPIRVTRTLAPVAVTPHDTNAFVVDFGEVVAGRVRVKLDAPGIHRLTLAHGEKLTEAGVPNVADGESYTLDGFQTDRCTLVGPSEWAPDFTYHGFRYVLVSGWPDGSAPSAATITAEVLHTDLARLGDFRASDALLTKLHCAAVRTVEINLHGLPTDTPTYEKNGWAGDGMLAAELMLTNLDCEVLLEKWLDDIVDSCDADGRPQVIAPSPGWGDRYKPSPTWHSDLVLVPWWLYLYRGNRTVLQRHYPAMRRYVLREFADSSDGLAYSVLNDWCSPETDAWGGDAPDDHRVSGTAYLYRMLTTMDAIARALDQHQDATEYTARAAAVYRSFNGTFFDGVDRYRGIDDDGYRQTHNVLALAFGLVPAAAVPAVAAGVAADVTARNSHLNTGVLGSKYLLPVLSRHGYEDLALRVARQTTYPSWGMWIAQGSATLWEHWREESRSRSHFMFGTYDDWFFQDVLGITPLQPGFRRIRICPARLAGLDWAEGEVPTPFGPIELAWHRDGAGRRLRAGIPTGCTADIVLRYGDRVRTATVRGGVHEMEAA